MRIIKPSKLEEFWRDQAVCRKPLLIWLKLAKPARWGSLDELRQTFGSADEVTVASGRKAVVFNIKGNSFRLITAVHYQRKVSVRIGGLVVEKIKKGKIHLFFLLTHAEYSRSHWREQL